MSEDNSVHHAAIVTGVLPNGEVLYSQHSGDAYDYDLQDREPYYEDCDGEEWEKSGKGKQQIIVVRPRCSW